MCKCNKSINCNNIIKVFQNAENNNKANKGRMTLVHWINRANPGITSNDPWHSARHKSPTIAGDRKGLKAFFNKSPAGAGNPSALEGRPPLTKEIYNYQPIDVVIMGWLRVFASHCAVVSVVFFCLS